MKLWKYKYKKNGKSLCEMPFFYAVSYTHLRAHETGRNLVCRLLLEKKKNEDRKKLVPKERKGMATQNQPAE